MRLFQVPIFRKATTLLAVAPMMLTTTGCPKVSGTITTTYTETQSCGPAGCTTTITFTVGGNINIGGGTGGTTPPKPQASDFTSIVSANAANFTPSPLSPAQATLSATTDQGYTSSITVNLEQVASTTAPVNSGDAVYTYAISSADTTAVNNWVNTVASNSNATANMTASTTVPLASAGIGGSYTTTGQGNTTGATAPLTIGSGTVIIANNPCGTGTHTKCYQQ
jgi:hypothetical protein